MGILLLIIGVIVLGPVGVLVLVVLGTHGVLALGTVAGVLGVVVGLALGSGGVAAMSAVFAGACVFGMLPARPDRPLRKETKPTRTLPLDQEENAAPRLKGAARRRA